MTTTHRDRERAARRAAERHRQAQFGDRVICATCGATYATFDDACTADLDTLCDGYVVVELVAVGHDRNLTDVSADQLARCRAIADAVLATPVEGAQPRVPAGSPEGSRDAQREKP